jgi:hypothetical protein
MSLQQNAAELMLIMTIGPLPDALDPGFHCVRAHWIRGFIAFQLARRVRAVVLMVPVWPESGIRVRAAPTRYIRLSRIKLQRHECGVCALRSGGGHATQGRPGTQHT